MKLKAGAEALFQNYFEMLKLESVQLQPQREVTRRSKAYGSTAGSPRSSSPSNKAFPDAGDVHVESKSPGSAGTLGCREDTWNTLILLSVGIGSSALCCALQAAHVNVLNQLCNCPAARAQHSRARAKANSVFLLKAANASLSV